MFASRTNHSQSSTSPANWLRAVNPVTAVVGHVSRRAPHRLKKIAEAGSIELQRLVQIRREFSQPSSTPGIIRPQLPFLLFLLSTLQSEHITTTLLLCSTRPASSLCHLVVAIAFRDLPFGIRPDIDRNLCLHLTEILPTACCLPLDVNPSAAARKSWTEGLLTKLPYLEEVHIKSPKCQHSRKQHHCHHWRRTVRGSMELE
jgi:hypothetical protein